LPSGFTRGVLHHTGLHHTGLQRQNLPQKCSIARSLANCNFFVIVQAPHLSSPRRGDGLGARASCPPRCKRDACVPRDCLGARASCPPRCKRDACVPRHQELLEHRERSHFFCAYVHMLCRPRLHLLPPCAILQGAFFLSGGSQTN
jgi:hypothetical protein